MIYFLKNILSKPNPFLYFKYTIISERCIYKKKKFHSIFHNNNNNANSHFHAFKNTNITGQILDLLLKGHQFESYEPQGHWRLTWSLTSGPVRLVEVRVNWLNTDINLKKHKLKQRYASRLIFFLIYTLIYVLIMTWIGPSVRGHFGLCTRCWSPWIF
jgi:hypothetical protein